MCVCMCVCGGGEGICVVITFGMCKMLTEVLTKKEMMVAECVCAVSQS